MDETVAPDALIARDVAPRTKKTNYPPEFAARVEGREKHALGDVFGLKTFGVNLTRLAPGASSALHHRHSLQDEMIFVVSGSPTLFAENRRADLHAGMVAGFSAGGIAHHLSNLTAEDCWILEIGDRTQGDQVDYPHDDLAAVARPEGGWSFAHKDGTPY